MTNETNNAAESNELINPNYKDIRIRNVRTSTVSQLKNIAEYYSFGSVTALLKNMIGDVMKNTPEHIKNFKHLGSDEED